MFHSTFGTIRCRGCSVHYDQWIPFTVFIVHTVNILLHIIDSSYRRSKFIDFINNKNGFKCFDISSRLLASSQFFFLTFRLSNSRCASVSGTCQVYVLQFGFHCHRGRLHILFWSGVNKPWFFHVPSLTVSAMVFFTSFFIFPLLSVVDTIVLRAIAISSHTSSAILPRICMYVCMYVYMYARLHVCMYVCMYVITYVCIYACMYICMYLIKIYENYTVDTLHSSIDTLQLHVIVGM